MNISFFASSYYLGVNPAISTEPILFRGSSLIRGEQMAQFLGGKYNPTQSSEHDICVYIKPKTVAELKTGAWVDVVDNGRHNVEQLINRPDLNVIAFTKLSHDFIKQTLKNKIVVIPEHHCNFERIKRSRKRVTTAGIVTTPSLAAYQVYNQIEKQLEKVGIKFRTCYHFATRQDVVDFYQQIDFQVVGYFGYGEINPFGHPNKIINAASFGIPTIAYQKLGYQEFASNYLPIKNMSELELEVEKLKERNYYEAFAGKIINAAEQYHIENIAKKYKVLT